MRQADKHYNINDIYLNMSKNHNLSSAIGQSKST